MAADSVPRAKRVEHSEVRLPGVRPIIRGGGGAVSRLPRDFGHPDDLLVWLIVNPACACAWGWTTDREHIKGGMEAKLVRCVEVEGSLHHTAVHHLTPQGFTHEHLPAPGCTR